MIPRVLHRVWLGSAIPEDAEHYWAEWQRLLGDEWTYLTWVDGRGLEHQDLYDDAEKLTAGNVWQLRSDLLRYELLWRCGGVYVDCDMEPLRSIEPLLAGVDAFAAWERQDVWVNNAILGATRGHPFIRALLDEVRGSVLANRTRRPNHATGPRFLTRVHVERPGELRVFDESLMYPYTWSELDRRGESFPEAYTVHHWANARRTRAMAAS